MVIGGKSQWCADNSRLVPSTPLITHAAQTAAAIVNATFCLLATMIELPNSIIDVDRFVTDERPRTECRHTGKRARKPRDRGKRESSLYIRMCHLININKPFRLALMGQWLWQVRHHHVKQVGELVDVERIRFLSRYLLYCPIPHWFEVGRDPRGYLFWYTCNDRVRHRQPLRTAGSDDSPVQICDGSSALAHHNAQRTTLRMCVR